jgi:hypothetical protein
MTQLYDGRGILDILCEDYPNCYRVVNGRRVSCPFHKREGTFERGFESHCMGDFDNQFQFHKLNIHVRMKEVR